MSALQGNGWKTRAVLQVEGMVKHRRTEAERSKSCVGDGKISLWQQAYIRKYPKNKKQKKNKVTIFPSDVNIHLNFTV